MRRKVTQLRCRQRTVRACTIRNILTEAAEFRCQNCQFERTLCPAGKNFSSGKILSRSEDQGLFVACTLARSHWSTRSHRRNSTASRVLSKLPKCIHNSIDAQLNHELILLQHSNKEKKQFDRMTFTKKGAKNVAARRSSPWQS